MYVCARVCVCMYTCVRIKALGRLPSDLPLDKIIDTAMEYVLDPAEPKAGYV